MIVFQRLMINLYIDKENIKKKKIDVMYNVIKRKNIRRKESERK